MPAQRPRASFEPIAPDFNLNALVEATPNFSYVDRISCDMIDQQGMAAFEKLVLLHVIIGGKPLVIDGFEDRLDPWTFNPKWLRDNSGDKVENARNLTAKENLPLTMGHYLKNMGLLTNQFFDKPGAYREKGRQRVYLKDIDCPQVWWDKLKEHMPPALTYLNDSTGDIGGPGAQPDPHSTQPGRRVGKGIARAGDLMSSLPSDMRAENLMCYVGHEGTYTPAHREMCASLGQNIMVEASNNVSEDGKAEKPGSSIWFMTESKDRHLVSEYFLSVLGHDIEVENHFAQVVAWKKAPFSVYVVEQRPGDFILIPPLAPHQVWNRGTRTMKVAWNRTTVETLEMAINEALPRSRIVCREEQYKNKAIIYYTLQRYASLLSQAMGQAARMPRQDSDAFLYKGKIKQLFKDFKRLFDLYKQILLSEMFSPDDRDAPKNIEYIPFDSNVTCAYCRCNIFNRFLTCPNCKDLLGHQADEDGDPYDVCMDCYAMGRSCACLASLKWVEQFRWKELASKYDMWRKLIIQLDGGQNDKSPQVIQEERRRYGKKTLAEVCKDQLKRRPFKDVKKPADEPKEDEESDEEIVVGDDGVVKKIQKKKSKTWLKNNVPCHVCCHRHPTWKMAKCTTCERSWCYGSLFRGWDRMPMEIMEDQDWSCPHCLGICFAGACKREGKMAPYEPKGTLLGHDTKKVADVRSVEALVDFSISNLNWLKDDDPTNRTHSRRIQKARAEADRNKSMDPSIELGDDEDHLDKTQVEMEYSPTGDETTLDPALGGSGAGPSSRRRQKQPADELDEDDLARRLQEANSALPPPAAMVAGASANGMPAGYAPLAQVGYSGAPQADMYGDPDAADSYHYPGYQCDQEDSLDPETESALRPFKKRRRSGRDGDDDGDFDEIAMSKGKRAKKPRLAAAGFRSYDLAETPDSASASRAKNEAQQQFEKEKERKALEKAKKEGRFIVLQAAMKGKKRVVRLSISGARLAQLAAQQAAQAALTAGDDEDAEHEVEPGAAQTNGDDEDDNDLLLKSDVAPKKTPRDLQNMYAEKVREGRILTGNTKKALIPVEKDEDYGYRYRERGTGKRVDRMKDLPATAASKKEKRKSQGGRPYVEYEEVDVASDDDDFEGNEFGWNAVNGTAKSNRNRRSLPGYLQERHADDDPDMPDELPEDHRDKHHNLSRSGRTGYFRSGPKARASDLAASCQLQSEVAATVKQGQVAGKASGMRSNPSKQPIEIDDDGNSSDDDLDDAIKSAANGDFRAQTTDSPTTNGSGKQRSSTCRPRGRPPTFSENAVVSPSSSKTTAAEAAARQAQEMMEEDNRLAKLQVLEMLDDPNSPRADMFSSTARAGDNLFGEDESDDGMDEVPARSTKV